MNRFARQLDVGWLFIGAVVVIVGIYYFLRNTLGFDIGELDGERIWPILVIGLGASILLRVWRHAADNRSEPPGQ